MLVTLSGIVIFTRFVLFLNTFLYIAVQFLSRSISVVAVSSTILSAVINDPFALK